MFSLFGQQIQSCLDALSCCLDIVIATNLALVTDEILYYCRDEGIDRRMSGPGRLARLAVLAKLRKELPDFRVGSDAGEEGPTGGQAETSMRP